MKNYVQIGANIGNDNFMDLVNRHYEKLNVFLIEPNTDIIPDLIINYSDVSKKHKVTIHPQAIALKEGEEDMYLYSNDIGEVHGNHSLVNRKTHPLRKTVKTKKVTTTTFNNFCYNQGIDEITVLMIDTEGLDYEILNSIDLDKVNIQTIYFEEWPVEEDDINNKYRTGPSFLNSHLKPKFNNYTWSKELLGGMHNFKLIKNEHIH